MYTTANTLSSHRNSSPSGSIELTQQQNDPIINWVHFHLQQALQHNASDIHLEALGNHYRLRYRIDGRLLDHEKTNLANGQRALARLKIMAHLDTAEYRLPQDGQFGACYRNELFYFRLSTCPTTQGEKAVVRILNHQHFKSLHQLDLTPNQTDIVQNALNKLQGLILVCGPTGSGKTTSLYAALDYLNQGHYNIVTAEDPAEIDLPGINQVNINPKLNLRFDQLLRSFLRQDPDIIMIGEIRDSETAAMAIKAAQTGHLVLATLHSNTTQKAFSRLRHLGLSDFDIKEACQLIMAQRLIPRLCINCRQHHSSDQTSLQHWGIKEPITTYKPYGCEYCHFGYQGRLALHELMTISNQQIYQNDTLQQLGIQALKTGQTSYEALLRYIE